jgi:hypothetical protein
MRKSWLDFFAQRYHSSGRVVLNIVHTKGNYDVPVLPLVHSQLSHSFLQRNAQPPHTNQTYPVALITIDHPEKRNALDLNMMVQFADAVEELYTPPYQHCNGVVIAGVF